MASSSRGLAQPHLGPYGVMFHHFHGRGHPVGQGSISASDLESIIRRLGRQNILDAADWMESALRMQLRKNAVCLTFDDNLRCQFHLGLQV